MLWHGSSTRGNRQTDSYCETWRTDNPAVTGMASSLQDGYLLQQLPHGCASSFIVLCIENSYTAEWTKTCAWVTSQTETWFVTSGFVCSSTCILDKKLDHLFFFYVLTAVWQPSVYQMIYIALPYTISLTTNILS